MAGSPNFSELASVAGGKGAGENSSVGVMMYDVTEVRYVRDDVVWVRFEKVYVAV